MSGASSTRQKIWRYLWLYALLGAGASDCSRTRRAHSNIQAAIWEWRVQRAFFAAHGKSMEGRDGRITSARYPDRHVSFVHFVSHNLKSVLSSIFFSSPPLICEHWYRGIPLPFSRLIQSRIPSSARACYPRGLRLLLLPVCSFSIPPTSKAMAFGGIHHHQGFCIVNNAKRFISKQSHRAQSLEQYDGSPHSSPYQDFHIQPPSSAFFNPRLRSPATPTPVSHVVPRGTLSLCVPSSSPPFFMPR